MKKFISILFAVLLLCTLCVPVLAAEKSAEDYIREANEYQDNEQYEAAAKSYITAANLYEDAGDPDSAATAYAAAGEVFAFIASNEGTDDFVSVANTYMKAGECYEKGNVFFVGGYNFECAASNYAKAGDFASVSEAYIKAGKTYDKGKIINDAVRTFKLAAEAAQKKANELKNGSTASTLSEGSLVIICTVAAAVVFGLGGFILGTKKKKKPAASDE